MRREMPDMPNRVGKVSLGLSLQYICLRAKLSNLPLLDYTDQTGPSRDMQQGFVSPSFLITSKAYVGTMKNPNSPPKSLVMAFRIEGSRLLQRSLSDNAFDRRKVLYLDSKVGGSV